jgi:hypothetical protein
MTRIQVKEPINKILEVFFFTIEHINEISDLRNRSHMT